MQRNSLVALVSASVSLFMASHAHAAGFALQEQGASGLGNAYSGMAAVAEDASTVWWNPAGMARLAPGKHLALAGVLIAPTTEFHNTASVAAALQPLGGEGGNAGESQLVPSGFYAMDLGPRWNFGLGINVPFGLSTHYDSGWIGRFQGIKSEVTTINVNPAVSYRINDRLSIGGGISYQHGKIDLTTATNYSAAAFAAGGAALLGAIGGPGVEGQNTTSVDGHAWGFNVGALFNVAPTTRLGIHYRSSLDYDLEGNTSFSNRPAALAAGIPDSDVKLSLKTPDSVSFSAVHDLGQRVQLLADATWTHWARIRQVPLVRSSGTFSGQTLDTLTFNFKDVWRFSGGVNYRFTDTTTLKAGLSYDKTPVPNAESRSVRLPDSDRVWFSIGGSMQFSPVDKLDAGYMYVTMRDAGINNDQTASGKGLVNGSYSAHIHIIGVQYQHSF